MRLLQLHEAEDERIVYELFRVVISLIEASQGDLFRIEGLSAWQRICVRPSITHPDKLLIRQMGLQASTCWRSRPRRR